MLNCICIHSNVVATLLLVPSHRFRISDSIGSNFDPLKNADGSEHQAKWPALFRSVLVVTECHRNKAWVAPVISKRHIGHCWNWCDAWHCLHTTCPHGVRATTGWSSRHTGQVPVVPWGSFRRFLGSGGPTFQTAWISKRFRNCWTWHDSKAMSSSLCFKSGSCWSKQLGFVKETVQEQNPWAACSSHFAMNVPRISPVTLSWADRVKLPNRSAKDIAVTHGKNPRWVWNVLTAEGKSSFRNSTLLMTSHPLAGNLVYDLRKSRYLIRIRPENKRRTGPWNPCGGHIWDLCSNAPTNVYLPWSLSYKHHNFGRYLTHHSWIHLYKSVPSPSVKKKSPTWDVPRFTLIFSNLRHQLFKTMQHFFLDLILRSADEPLGHRWKSMVHQNVDDAYVGLLWLIVNQIHTVNHTSITLQRSVIFHSFIIFGYVW